MSHKNQRDKERSKDRDGKPDAYPDIPQDVPHLPESDAGQKGKSNPGVHPKKLHAARQQSLANPFPGKEDDGGESILSSRPRETGGERP